MNRLAGKVSVVTGGASGIGAGTVRQFVAEGGSVIIADVQDGPGADLAAELGDRAVFVHTDVTVETDVTELGPEKTAQRLDAARDHLRQSQPIGRLGEAADIAELVTFLASDASTWITGTAQVIDGGLTLGKPWRRQPAAITERRTV